MPFIQPPSLRQTPRVGAGFAPQAMRGFQVNNDFSSAGNIAQIDARGFIAEAESGAAIGQGIADMGTAANHIYVAQQHVVNRRRELEVEQMRTMASEDIAKKIAEEQDETKWPALVEKEAENHAKAWQKMPLAPESRDNIAAADVAWKHHLIASAGASSRERSVKLLGDTYNAHIYALRQQKDFAGAREKVQQAVGDGVLSEGSAMKLGVDLDIEEADHTIKSISAEVDHRLANGDIAGAKEAWSIEPPKGIDAKSFSNMKRAALDEIEHKWAVNQTLDKVTELALTDPSKGLEEFDKGSFRTLPPEMEAKVKQTLVQAREQAANKSVIEGQRAVEMLAPDKLDSATIDSLGVDMKQATPWHRAQITEALELRKAKGPEGIARRQAAYEAKFGELWAKAGKPPASGDEFQDTLEQARFETEINSLPQELRDKLTAKRSEVMQPGNDSAIAVGDAVAFVHEQMTAMKDAATGLPLLRKNAERYVTKPGEVKTLFGIDWMWKDSAPETVKADESYSPAYKTLPPERSRLLTIAEKQLAAWIKTPEAKGKNARVKMIEILRSLGVNDLTGTQDGPDNTLVGDKPRFDELTK